MKESRGKVGARYPWPDEHGPGALVMKRRVVTNAWSPLQDPE